MSEDDIYMTWCAYNVPHGKSEEVHDLDRPGFSFAVEMTQSPTIFIFHALEHKQKC